MWNLPSIGLFAALACFCGVTTQSVAADEPAQPRVPNFSSVDFPWFPATGFLPPPSGPGPVVEDKTKSVIRRTANNVGDVEEGPVRFADLSNPNLKPWIIDHLRNVNEDLLAGKLRYASRASCRPAGVPMFLT